jgi:hypothetical protein
VSASLVVLLSNPVSILTQVLLLVQNVMTFVLSKFDVKLLSLNHLFKVTKTFIQF